ncbi:hypothetical protein ACRAWC_03000 [Leifsonia sp. L25]|uniref:hypothetical protein n=1 Tax=Leifsonia sp. L25 TaxID=3423957 RepID=UPI003D68C632
MTEYAEMNDGGMIVGGVWIAVLATAALVFRPRVVAFLVRFTVADTDEESRRRDLRAGVALLAAFAYVLVATLASVLLIPRTMSLWAIGIGLPIAVVINVLYWVRFRRAGLSVRGWTRGD